MTQNQLRTKYLELLSAFGLKEPEPPIAVGDAAKFISTMGESKNERQRQAVRDTAPLLELEFIKQALKDPCLNTRISDTILDKDLEPILKQYRFEGTPLDPAVYFNEFPTWSFNAEIIKCQEGYLCLLSSGLLRLIRKILVFAFYPVATTEISQAGGLIVRFDLANIESSSGLTSAGKAIFEMCADYLRNQSRIDWIAHQPAADIKPGAFLLAASLDGAAKSFVMAHEIAHYRLGHLETAPACYVSTTNNSNIGVLSIDRDAEIQADLEATRILIALTPSHSTLYPLFCGSLAFLYSLYTIEHMREKLVGGSYSTGTHPPTSTRIAAVRAFLKSTLPPKEWDKALRLEFLLQSVLQVSFNLAASQHVINKSSS